MTGGTLERTGPDLGRRSILNLGETLSMTRPMYRAMAISVAFCAIALAAVGSSALPGHAQSRAMPGQNAGASQADAANAALKGESETTMAEPAGDGTAPAPTATAPEATTSDTTMPETATGTAEPAAEIPVKVTKTRILAGETIGQDSQGNPIIAPDDEVARKAFDVLMKHCARCHQDGLLTARTKPAKNFGNVLMLDELASDGHLVQPGNPDGSKIVQQILNQEMPYDVYNEFETSQPAVTGDDVEALRAWIGGLSGSPLAPTCENRSFIGNDDVVKAIAADLEKQASTKVAGTRYLTLSHLYNACASAEALNVYAQGAVKLLNSLSGSSDVVRLAPIDAAGTILRFNLADLGWTEADWNQLLSVYPYAVRADTSMTGYIEQVTTTPLPHIRADWFAYAASQPPLYDILIGMPDSFAELQDALGIDIEGDIAGYRVARAGVQPSGISPNNRLIERHTIGTGYFWTTYDFAGNGGRQSLFEHPLGPGGDGFAHEGGETLFSMPNGFQASFMADAAGNKRDKGPTAVIQDLSRRDLTATNGISCMGCHDGGIISAKDAVRDAIVSDRTFAKEVREAVETLYPESTELERLFADDRARFDGAMRRAGLDPTLKLNGVEMVNALATRFEQPLDAALAGAEFGLSAQDFLDALGQAGTPGAVRLKRRFEQGLVPRDEFESGFAELVDRLTDDAVIALEGSEGAEVTAVPSTAEAATSRPGFDLALISDKSTYNVDDLAIFTVNAERDCFLTLIDVDQAGTATVIFPNRFTPDNHISAGADFEFPGPDAKFQFRMAEAGVETVIATCNTQDRSIDGIEHDYAVSAFTDLGNYDQFVKRAVMANNRKLMPAETAAGSDGKTETRNKPEPSARGALTARAAIRVEVR